MKQNTLPNLKAVQSHSRRGLSFESELEKTHKLYEFQKFGKIEKNEKVWSYASPAERANILKTNCRAITAVTDNSRVLITRKSKPDFSGHILGRYIEFDAKETKGKSLPFANISRHQIEQLLRTQATGGISGLMIHFSELERCFFLPATEVDTLYIEMLYKRGAKSIPLAVCETNGVEVVKNQNLWNWFEAMKVIYKF